MCNECDVKQKHIYSLYDSANDLFSDLTQSFCASLSIKCKINTHFSQCEDKTTKNGDALSVEVVEVSTMPFYRRSTRLPANERIRALPISIMCRGNVSSVFSTVTPVTDLIIFIATMEFRLNLLLAYFVHFICKMKKKTVAAAARLEIKINHDDLLFRHFWITFNF